MMRMMKVDGQVEGEEVNLNGIWGDVDINECVRDALNSQVQL